MTDRLITYYRIENIEETPQVFDDVMAEVRYQLQQEAKKIEYQRLARLAAKAE